MTLQPATTTANGSSQDFHTLVPVINLEHEGMIALAICCLVIGILAICLNSIVISFNLSQTSSLFPFLNTCLATSDLISGIASLMAGIYMVSVKQNTMESIRYYVLYTVFVLSAFSIRVSAFYTPVIAIVRSLNIALPLTTISIRLLRLILGLYALLWLGVLISELYHYIALKSDETSTAINLIWNFSCGVETLNSLLELIFGGKKLESLWITADFLLIFLTQIIPSIITLISAIHQIVSLKKMMLATNSRSVEMKHDISRTVLLLTSVFFVCNTISLGEMEYSINRGKHPQGSKLAMSFVMAYLFPFINSTLNPMIMIWRCKALRNSVKKFLTRACSGAANGPRRMENPKTHKSGVTLSKYNASTKWAVSSC